MKNIEFTALFCVKVSLLLFVLAFAIGVLIQLPIERLAFLGVGVVIFLFALAVGSTSYERM